MDPTPDEFQILGLGSPHFFAGLATRLEKYQSDKPALNRLNLAHKSNDLGKLYELNIDTKYYTTSKILRTWSAFDGLSGSSAIEAVVVLFEPTLFEASFAQKLEDLLSQVEEDALKTLVSSSKHRGHESITRLKESFEFVDFYFELEQPDGTSRIDQDQEVATEEEEIEDFINSFFVHQWQSMNMVKAPNQFQIKKGPEDMNPDGFKEAKSLKAESVSPETARDVVEPSEEENEGFEHLLMNLKDMKVKAEGMSSDERKKYAENVVMSFWRSIGGNEDEIADLGDDLSDLDD